MEYDDNKISTPDEFDELAKEYKNREFQNFDKIFEKLFLINTVYSYVAKNIRSFRLRETFLGLAKQTELDLDELSKIYKVEDKNFHYPKRFKSYYFCLRLLLKTEAEFLELSLSNNLPNEITFEHLENLKTISSLI